MDLAGGTPPGANGAMTLPQMTGMAAAFAASAPPPPPPPSSRLPSDCPNDLQPDLQPSALHAPKEKLMSNLDIWSASGFPPAVSPCVMACCGGEVEIRLNVFHL